MFVIQFSRYKYRFSSAGFFKPSGDDEIRTRDPLLARQVLSQLSYAPISFSKPFLYTLIKKDLIYIFKSGLKWTRTTDLTLIRRAL